VLEPDSVHRDTAASQARRWQVGFISLGCPKNQVDCELMLGAAIGAGFEITARIEEADAIVVNTCCFIAAAQDEARREILKAQRYRGRGRCRALVVTGCLPQYLQERSGTEYPGVDAWLGPDAPLQIAPLLKALLEDRKAVRASGSLAQRLPQPTFLPDAQLPRVLSTPPSLAYVKIADGCNHRCRFCIIPRLRGRYRSRPLEDVLREVEGLIQRGLPEIVLVSQDSSAYGSDRGKRELPELLDALGALPGDHWLRVMYLHPDGIDDALLEAWARQAPRVLPYFDLPLQHVSARVLEAMGRGGDRTQIDSLLKKIRAACPGAVIRTSLISGYPGETEAEHRELLDWVSSGVVDRLGVFAYSDLPELRSHDLADHIPAEEAARRSAELIEAQSAHAFELAQVLVGTRQHLVLDTRLPGASRIYEYSGRTWRDSYSIDGVVRIQSAEPLTPGTTVDATITAANGYDLNAKL
jgi:ribosomal protein S12 methylthiotransferase